MIFWLKWEILLYFIFFSVYFAYFYGFLEGLKWNSLKGYSYLIRVGVFGIYFDGEDCVGLSDDIECVGEFFKIEEFCVLQFLNLESKIEKKRVKKEENAE